MSRKQKFRDRFDYESWPQVQCAKPLTWKRAWKIWRKYMYSKEQLNAAIDEAVEAFCLESLKYQQEGRLCIIANWKSYCFGVCITANWKSYCFAHSVRPSVCRQNLSIAVSVSPLTALMMENAMIVEVRRRCNAQ